MAAITGSGRFPAPSNTGPWAFAQLTYRESLRDIETCLSVHASKLYHMGFRQPVRRSTLADANERPRLAYPCGVGPAAHHPGEDAVRRRRTGVGPDQYRLRPGLDDHRSVPVGLSVGALPHHQGGGEDAHAARTCGATFRVLSTSRMASCTTFMPSICSCRKPEPSTSWIVATSTLPAFMCCTKPGPSSSRVPSRTSMLIASIRRRRIARPASFATRPSPWDGFYTRQDYPELLRRIRFKDPESGKTLVFITNNFSLPAATICALYKSRWQVGTLLQVDQAASSDQAVLRHVGERGEDADLELPSRSTSSSPSSRSASTWTPRSTLCYRSSR